MRKRFAKIAAWGLILASGMAIILLALPDEVGRDAEWWRLYLLPPIIAGGAFYAVRRLLHSR